MVADGSEQENFWEMSSPFIMFDRYKSSASSEKDATATSHRRSSSHAPEDDDEDVTSVTQEDSSLDSHLSPTSGNVTFHDSNSEEQRFFPSFPAPYLGLSPFGSAPARAPLFPGPSANRAPSRYHPSTFGGGSPPPKYSSLANRGPSNVAASHDRYTDTNILGSGNFEVVRGGTYYGDEGSGGPAYHHGGGGGGGGAYHSNSNDDDDSYYHHNGHSSPYRGGSGDFFANFRDFADINPHSRSFSHNVEDVALLDHSASEPVGTHKVKGRSSSRRRSGTSSSSDKKPNNIFDQLELQEAESAHGQPRFSMEYDPMMATF
jgi:hypothetical protein